MVLLFFLPIIPYYTIYHSDQAHLNNQKQNSKNKLEGFLVLCIPERYWRWKIKGNQEDKIGDEKDYEELDEDEEYYKETVEDEEDEEDDKLTRRLSEWGRVRGIKYNNKIKKVMSISMWKSCRRKLYKNTAQKKSPTLLWGF
jgi:hypothetical protein